MRGKALLMLAAVTAAAAISGCGVEITTASADGGVYATQDPMSSLDYSTYMGKQITAFMNQLMTHITSVLDSGTGMYEEEERLAEESLKIMQDIYEEVTVTMPAKTADDDREGLLLAMEVSIGHMEGYIGALESGDGVSRYVTDFKNDMNALSMYANMYYQ